MRYVNPYTFVPFSMERPWWHYGTVDVTINGRTRRLAAVGYNPDYEKTGFPHIHYKTIRVSGVYAERKIKGKMVQFKVNIQYDMETDKEQLTGYQGLLHPYRLIWAEELA